MIRFIYLFTVILIFTSCKDDENSADMYKLRLSPHNSMMEFYAGLPVDFAIYPRGGEIENRPISLSSNELYINDKKVETPLFQYSFPEPGNYTFKLRGSTDFGLFEIDTTINIVSGPPVFGNQQRGENVLFGWKVGTNYKILSGTYYGSSVADYEVLTIDESLIQQGTLSKLDIGWYPTIQDHGASPSGKLVLVYDDKLAIYDAHLNLMHQMNFNYQKSPHKIFIKENKTVLMFDSLSHIILKTLDMSTGQIIKGPTQFIGVSGMSVSQHFFRDETRTITYYHDSNYSKTLLMGVNVGRALEFNHYFFPPLFVRDVTPLSSGGFIISSYLTNDGKCKISGADKLYSIRWTQNLSISHYLNDPSQQFSDRIKIKELDGFIYIFCSNMRCIKLSIDGKLIWDKYYYNYSASFDDVVVTEQGDFILFGTLRLSSNSSSNLGDPLLLKDIISVKIDTDGQRIGW